MLGKIRLSLAAIAMTTVPYVASAAEPSPEFRAGLRRTAELRKQHRRDRTARPPGTIIPYPLPPTLIIRHTPEVHDEVRDLLHLLRR